MKTGKTDPSRAVAANAGLSSILRSLLNQTIVFLFVAIVMIRDGDQIS